MQQNDYIILKADKGKILTDGNDVFGKTIIVRDKKQINNYYEMPEEEYKKQSDERRELVFSERK